ncbi:cyclophilin-like fold protein [Fournierella sp.]|uniref:cyclophilin-like fold protein n=1 Tax=Allofournierella sp. TaxID=1940256 RepID=UPI0025BF1842|nr:cyclophilin-like fold protein [Fournierella sp.]
MKKTGCVLLVGLCAALLTACGFGGSSASDVGSLPAVESNVQQVTEDMQLSETSGSTENNSESSSVEDNTNADITVEKETSDEESEEEAIMQQNTFYVSVGEKVFSATFADNSGAQALKELLADGDITIRMSDYGGFEKVGSLGQSLPTENSQTTTKSGDIVLYQGSQIVIFYGSNSWSYTRLGKIDDLAGWQEALGNGDVAVTLSMQDK